MSAKTCTLSAVAAALAVAVSLAGFPVAAEVPQRLISELERWIDANTDLPRRADPPRIVFMAAWEIREDQERAMSNGQRTRGLYDPASGTITLVEPWKPSNPEDVSVLLHELIHHRQPGIHRPCPASQEPEAYRLQQTWLEARGVSLDVDWVAIALTSGCKMNDVHP